MFSPRDSYNLIKDKRSINEFSDLHLSYNSFDKKYSEEKVVKCENTKSAFANFANITCVDDDILERKQSTLGNIYDTKNFSGIGLYRPFGINDDNPLNRNVYQYSMSSASTVRGMAFINSNSEYVSNPLTRPCNIVDNTFEFCKNAIANNDFNDVINVCKSVDESTRKKNGEIPQVEYNTYKMADILSDSTNSRVVDFGQYNRNVALVKSTWFNTFLGNQKRFLNSIKNLFKKETIK